MAKTVFDVLKDKLNEQIESATLFLQSGGPKDIEIELSRLVADAGKQVTEANKQRAAQQQAQQKMKEEIY